MEAQIVHIRHPEAIVGDADPLCGRSGGTISFTHFFDNPTGHVSSLIICPDCEETANCIGKTRPVWKIYQNKS